jgi:hypothetical protein
LSLSNLPLFLPISYFLLSLPKWYLARIIGHAVSRYTIFYPCVLIRPKYLLSTNSHLTLSLCDCLNVIDGVSRPYETTGKIIVLYIL